MLPRSEVTEERDEPTTSGSMLSAESNSEDSPLEQLHRFFPEISFTVGMINSTHLGSMAPQTAQLGGPMKSE